jgi:hypothetical protein
VVWWGLGKSAPLARCAVRPWGTLILIKLVAAIALIAVYNKQTVHTNSLVLYMRVKVL